MKVRKKSHLLDKGCARCLSHCCSRAQLLQNAFPECFVLHRHAKPLLPYQSVRVRLRCFIPQAVPRRTASLPQQVIGCVWEYWLPSAAQLGWGWGVPEPPLLTCHPLPEPLCDGCTMGRPRSQGQGRGKLLPAWAPQEKAGPCLQCCSDRGFPWLLPLCQMPLPVETGSHVITNRMCSLWDELGQGLLWLRCCLLLKGKIHMLLMQLVFLLDNTSRLHPRLIFGLSSLLWVQACCPRMETETEGKRWFWHLPLFSRGKDWVTFFRH